MPGPTPIAFGITELNVGGAEKSLIELVTRLNRDRWKPIVFSLQPCGPLAKKLDEAGIEVVSLEMRSLRDSFKAYRKWRRLLKEIRPAVLVTFLFHANILGRFAARGAGIRHVSSIRVAERSARWHVALDRWTRRDGDRYVCVSQAVADFTRTHVNVPRKDITIVRNGVDLSQADDARAIDVSRWAIAQDELVLVAIGRLTEQKGPDILLRAFSHVSKAAHEYRVRLVFVGDGPLRTTLEAFVRDHQLDSIVTFVGQQQESFRWLHRSEGLALASRWEGMPNVVLEAMACHRPVIASRVEGVTELVVPDETGWLVPPNDVGAFAEALVDWMKSAQRRKSLGDAGRTRVERQFSIEKTIAEWDCLLTEICVQA